MERRLIVFVMPVAAFALLGALLVGSFATPQPHAGDGYLDRPMPQFAQPPIVGTKKGLSTDDLDGKVTLVNVFASWCASCRAEHPKLMQLTNEKGVYLYGINWKDRPGAGKVFLDQFGNPYKRTGDDSNGKLGTKLGVTGVPETFLIDTQGRIRYRHIGPINDKVWHDILKPLIEQLEASQ